MWANILSSFLVLGTFAGASASWVHARKSQDSARHAEEALITILRPEFVPDVDKETDNEINIGFSNVARHDALDIRAEIRTTDGRKLGEGDIHRAAGHVPNTRGGSAEFWVPVTDLPELNEVGASYELIMVLWFSDERAMRRWRQELRMTRTLIEENRRTRIQSQNHLARPVSMSSAAKNEPPSRR